MCCKNICDWDNSCDTKLSNNCFKHKLHNRQTYFSRVIVLILW